MRLAIIGGDAAGMSAASAAKRRSSELDVVAFERGPYTSYSACGIPYYVGGLFDDSDRLISRSPEEHRARGIAVHTRTEVTAIGLEMAEALVQRGIPTTLVEAAPQVMTTLDPDMAAHVQDGAEGVGVRVMVGTA